MARLRQKRRRVALPATVLSFLAAWATTGLLVPETFLSAVPRWKSTLLTHLSAHFIEFAQTNSLGLVTNEISLVQAAGLPATVHLIPFCAVGLASGYVCHTISTPRIQQNIENALRVGIGYLVLGLAAIVISDMRPAISSLLMVAIVLLGAVWIGSTVVSSATRGLPFFGITSLGTVAVVGLLVILGGVAVVVELWGLFAVSLGAPIIAGSAVGMSRQLKRIGGRRRDFARIRGAQELVQDYWFGLLVTAVVTVALYVAITGSV